MILEQDFNPEDHTLLLVDDTEENIDILIALLDGYDVLVALDGESALEMLAEEQVDLILLDILMPGIDGYETCRRLKSNANTKHIPVIFSTAKTDEESIALGYDAGGIDYVTKPFKPKELQARVKTQLSLKRLINKLEHLSSYDPLTGIMNRRKFFELAEALFVQRSEQTTAIMIDIDKFKRINDLYGHGVGDDVIKLTASTLQENLPGHAFVARLGGEEFAIVGQFPSWNDACKLAEALRTAIEANEIALSGETLKYTISIGVAWQTEQHNKLDELLATADSLLYEAKETGRNKTVFRQQLRP